MPRSLAAVTGLLLIVASLGLTATAALADQPTPLSEALAAEGETAFVTELSPETGLGPLFNGRSCVACHADPSVGGTGGDTLGAVVRVGRLTDSGFDPMIGQGGPVARTHSVREVDPGRACDLPVGIPLGANVTSIRIAPQLYGVGLIGTIPQNVIEQNAANEAEAVRGRPNLVQSVGGSTRVGRFGWKADTPDLETFVANALRTEQGLTNPLAPEDLLPTLPRTRAPCAGEAAAPKDDGSRARALTAFTASLPAPSAARGVDALPGRVVFDDIGCSACHTATLPGRSGAVPLFSDLLLHDMGSDLDDGVPQAQARGQDWRTTPLWGLGQRRRFLHDGRARSISAATAAHGGQAAATASAFRLLGAEDRVALLAFLASL